MSFTTSDYIKYETIQALWSDYGELARYRHKKTDERVVVKEINLSGSKTHPRSWQSNFSHQRKLSSYHNEINFYQHYAKLTNGACYVPKFIYSSQENHELRLVLEDLDPLGFNLRFIDGNVELAKICLNWLSAFHAATFKRNAEQLWQPATYWHLQTRPDEFEAMADGKLKEHASSIDNILRSAKFKCFVHGDAKLANFCFHRDGKKTAAVDFQYVGIDTPVKDVAYLLGSCFFDKELDRRADRLFEYYLKQLTGYLTKQLNLNDIGTMIAELRYLYPFAWADFERFLSGWAPDHKKLSAYSALQTLKCLNNLEKP